MGELGYGTSREARADLLRKLRSAPDWFRETRPGTFTKKSASAIVGYKRREFYIVDASMLHKRQARVFADLLINIQAAGQNVPAQDICNNTGFGRARVFAALKTGRGNGFSRCKILIPVQGMTFTSKGAAFNAARDLLTDKFITDVVEEDGLFVLTQIVGLSFNHYGAESDGETRHNRGDFKILRPAPSNGKKYKPTTTVFKITGDVRKVFNHTRREFIRYRPAAFLPGQAVAFFDRHNVGTPYNSAVAA